MIKTIWSLWLDGYNRAPPLVRACAQSWVERNRGDGWKVNLIDRGNLAAYIDERQLAELTAGKTVSPASLSDIIRLELLAKHGGLWVDSTVFCQRPIEAWDFDPSSSGFFVFRHDSDRKLASWLIYAEPGHHALERWHRRMREYVAGHDSIGAATPHLSIWRWRFGMREGQYFWLHYLFGDLLRRDPRFAAEIAAMPQRSARPMSGLQAMGLETSCTPQLQAEIASLKTPLQKLDWRARFPGDSSQSVLDFYMKQFAPSAQGQAR